MIRYLPGLYRIQPLGEHTQCEALIAGIGSLYLIVFPDTWQHITVSQPTLDRMRPMFIRTSDLIGDRSENND